MRADQEVVEVHADDGVMQRPGDVDAQAALGLGAVAFRRLGILCDLRGVQVGNQSEPGLEQPLVSDCCSEPSEPGRFWLKYSRFPQKSKT